MTGAPTSGGGGLASGRPSWVVIPALDEAATISGCLRALRVAAAHAPGPVHVIVVDDGSTDATAALARAALSDWPDGHHEVLAGPCSGVGPARRLGLDHALAAASAAELLVDGGALQAGEPDGPPPEALIATTDADSWVSEGWLSTMHRRLDEGHVVIAGDVHLETAADERLSASRAARLARRLASLPTDEAGARHPHFAASSLGFASHLLSALQPLPAPASLEDEAILARCRALGVPVLRDHELWVTTSARTTGRATAGLAQALAADLLAMGPAVAAE